MKRVKFELFLTIDKVLQEKCKAEISNQFRKKFTGQHYRQEKSAGKRLSKIRSYKNLCKRIFKFMVVNTCMLFCYFFLQLFQRFSFGLGQYLYHKKQLQNHGNGKK